MQYAYVLMYLKIDLFFNFVPNFKFKFEDSTAGILGGEFWYVIPSALG